MRKAQQKSPSCVRNFRGWSSCFRSTDRATPLPGDRFWTPADWAWAGGLLDALLPCLHHGVPVVARKFEKFDPEEAFALMAKMHVRNAFIPPTALRMLRSAPRPKVSIKLRSVGSGG